MARKIEVEIVGDSRSLERAFKRSEKSATRFQGTMRGVSRSIRSGFALFGVGIGAGLVVKGIEDAVSAASDLNEEVNKSRVVFKRATPEVLKWSKTTANAFAISETEALKAASNFGLLFNTFAHGSDQSAAMSKRFVELAGDLASFFNVSTDDALERLRSGLAGQARPLRIFGVLLSENAVKQEAYRSHIARTGAQLTDTQKLQARYNLILRQTKPAQGDAARTANSFANGMRRLGALVDDLKAKIGQGLLPQFNIWVQKLTGWLADEDNQKKIVNDLETAFSDLGTAITTAGDGISYLHQKWEDAKDLWDWAEKHQGSAHVGARTTTPSGQRRGGMGTGGLLGYAQSWAAEQLLRGVGLWHEKKIPLTAAQLRQATAQWGRQLLPDMPGSLGPLAPGSQGWPGDRRDKRDDGTIKGDKSTDSAKKRQRLIALRRTIFDNRIARQLDRVQDLGLRKQAARLAQIAQEVRAQIGITKDKTRRLALEDKLLEIYRQQKDVQSQITDQIKQANQLLKDRADAIKSAVLDRLQRKQQDVENKRAMQDAKEQLRLALLAGGPMGIKAARRAVFDAAMAQRIAKVEGAPASLTAGGVFRLGNIITINIHGITDPDKVAKAVVAAINKRGRHTANQTRGSQAGATAGSH